MWKEETDERRMGGDGCDGGQTDVFADAGLAEELEEFELAKGAETEHGVVEGGDLLDGDLATARSVYG